MLAYRHAFHAGNHADVLKHLVLVQVLQYMNQKPRPYTLIDTHAGAGAYSLGSAEARKKGEAELGIHRVLAHKARHKPPEAVERYLELLQAFNPGGGLGRYPGSPEIARMLLREDDPLMLYELHPTDVESLARHQIDRRLTRVHRADGFAAPRAHLPPPSRRAVLVMDPSYETRGDYPKVLAAVRETLQRFPETVILVWYPQVQRVEAAELPRRLKSAIEALGKAGAGGKPLGWLHARLTVQAADAQGFGLAGSGVFLVNPPWTLHEALKTSLPWLAAALAQTDTPSYVLDHRAV